MNTYVFIKIGSEKKYFFLNYIILNGLINKFEHSYKKVLIKKIHVVKIIDLRDIISLCKIKDLLRFFVKCSFCKTQKRQKNCEYCSYSIKYKCFK